MKERNGYEIPTTLDGQEEHLVLYDIADGGETAFDQIERRRVLGD